MTAFITWEFFLIQSSLNSAFWSYLRRSAVVICDKNFLVFFPPVLQIPKTQTSQLFPPTVSSHGNRADNFSDSKEATSFVAAAARFAVKSVLFVSCAGTFRRWDTLTPSWMSAHKESVLYLACRRLNRTDRWRIKTCNIWSMEQNVAKTARGFADTPSVPHLVKMARLAYLLNSWPILHRSPGDVLETFNFLENAEDSDEDEDEEGDLMDDISTDKHHRNKKHKIKVSEH